MLVRINNVGRAGVNKDVSNHELPLNAWTDALNVRFQDGSAKKISGHIDAYGATSVAPYFLLPVSVGGLIYWLYAGAAKVYCVSPASVHTNLTRQTTGVDVDYTAAINSWTGCVLGGIPVLNNGTDVPQMWNPVNTSQRLLALTAFPASTTCYSLRSYKNYLVAMNTTESGTSYPHKVRWSHPADPGAVPTSWNEADPTVDAGETHLPDDSSRIIDGCQLRDAFIIYKQDSTWLMQWTGGPFVFSFRKMFGTSGVLCRNAVCEFDGMHFVVTGSDIVVHDGASVPVSILDDISRRQFFSTLDETNYESTFVVKNPFHTEIWACYPEAGSAYCNKALVWNYKDRTVTFRDLPNVNYAAFGEVTGGVTTWSDAGTWATDTSIWNNTGTAPITARLLLASNDLALFFADEGTTFGATIPEVTLERTGLSIGEPESIKLIRSIRPRIRGTDGQTVTISVAGTDDISDTPSYTDTTFTIGSSLRANCLVSGRYMAIKFSSDSTYEWSLDSYDIDVVEAGQF